ncbi:MULTISPECIES: hypothetical protein [unclassified Sporosarcina]|uniref:PD-(D/E)XK nuclease domain-containing protein n=1 Tax=unclassified Sporosarcina TaxID=2647733 RepID=UPI00204191B9|nr:MULTISPECIES: hypothetical protein [unclassified Sporosarcina]GKV65206.1 hypothetical protein NCCP2331_13590 [Sporosarcina sp. NCCP-2331]GLB55330.1 hypothetical protein NCCP2378_11160 [Sporosarcina sp. NCCP-2378]
MTKNTLIIDPTVAMHKINTKKEELEQLNSQKNPYNEFGNWRHAVSGILEETFSTRSISRDFLTETNVFINKFSEAESDKNLKAAINNGKSYLHRLNSDIQSGKYAPEENKDNSIGKSTALIIIRRILRNFHKHIDAMYQSEVHGSGKIAKVDLDKIKIGNEYDVQRILYALIRPIFPEARLEAVDDAGYNSVRYDIVIAEYDIVIEVKCTRENMTERKLTEELGSDSFHYKANHLFLFVFDRVKLIKNLDAFERSFNRKKTDVGKEIETFVIQEVSF